MAPSDASRRRGGRPSRSDELTEERIGAAALDVIREVGVGGLTRALVAEAAGVSARATYRLAPNSDDLIALAVNEWQRAWRPPAGGDDWRSDLIDWSAATLDHMRAHPGLVAASRQIRSSKLSDVGQPTVVAAATVLVDRAGLDQATAFDVIGVLGMHCLAWEFTISSADRVEGADVDPATVAEHLAFLERGFLRGVGWLLDGAVIDHSS